jgi:GntR family transcriptional regulator
MNLKINHKSAVPLHQQAEEVLRKLIEMEEYKNGKFLPNEVDLSEQLGISRNTLRQAINKLVFEGMLVRRKGIGTKVVRKGIVSGIKNWLSFSQEMKMLGIEVRNFELYVGYKKPNDQVANFFEIDTDQHCLILERVRGNQEYPFVYFVSYFNPIIPLNGETSFNTPLYELLEKQHNIVVKTSKEEISASLASEFIAGKLGIKPIDPILIRKRFVYDEKDVAIEYNIGYYRADSFTYAIEAQR